LKSIKFITEFLYLLSLKNQISQKELFEAFQAQLARDFEQCNLSAEFVAGLKPDYHSILERITRELHQHEKKTDFNIMNLLYRVDISEAQLSRYLHENKEVNYLTVIAELIIKRELQKVVMKRHYRSGENLQ
jgi:hypothetical protein